MKEKKRGFTLVELVIVIAVIAILAGVMVAVFANVVKDAKESAKLQEEKQAELQQKMEDITAKLENADWLGWEDFENELAIQLANANASSLAEMKIAIDNALAEYAEKNVDDNTGLTEDQVRTIIERALSGQLTADQVKQIVAANSSDLTAAQVTSIVNKALANQLTTAQILALLNDQTKSIQEIIESNPSLTEEEIKAILDAYLPSTKDYAPGDTIDFNKLISGSTVNLTGDWSSATLDIVYDAAKTFTVTGSAVDTVNINAPAGTVNLYIDAATVNVIAIANDSLHIYSNITSLSVTTGRVVLEKGSVTTLTLSSSASDAITLEVGADVVVTTLGVEGAAGTVTVENNGTINAVTGSAASTVVVSGSGETATPENGDASNVVVNGETFVAYNGTIDVFSTAPSGSVIKLTADVNFDYTGVADAPFAAINIASDKTFVLDLNGHNITVTGTHVIFNEGTLTVIGDGTVDALSHAKAVLINAVNATAILNGGTFTRSLENGKDSENSGGNSYYVINNFGTLTVNSGVSVLQNGHYSSLLKNGWYDGAKTNGNDVGQAHPSWADSTNQYEAILIINGGTFEGGLNTIKNDDWGVATINGGVFTNYSQYVVMNNNKLDINGGYFYHGGSVAVGNFYYVGGMNEGILNITGGTFDGTIYKNSVSGTITITGGTFSNDVSTYVPDGYTYDSTTGTVSKN